MAGRMRMCAEEESTPQFTARLMGSNAHDQVNRESLSNRNPVLWEAGDGKVCACEAASPPPGQTAAGHV